MTRVVVIGGGPAGMMAAYMAATNGAQTVLLEAGDKLGRKLYITGKGRCNVTNTAGRDEYLQNVVRNPKFLYSAAAAFTPEDAFEFFEKYGVTLKTERGNRVFPESDKSSDILRAFDDALMDAGVRVLTNARVTGIETGESMAVTAKDIRHECDAIIIATGGVSYPQTGSTGDGYGFARDAGVNVTDVYPSLTALRYAKNTMADLTGVSLKNVTFTLKQNGKKLWSELGEMLFTETGVSGPLVLSASAYIKYDEPLILAGEIDLKPGLNDEQLDARLLRDFDANKNKSLINALFGLTLSALLPHILKRAAVDGEKKVHSVTAAERARIVEATKRFTFYLAGAEPIETAIVTRGGVNVREINAHTMECKNIPGLYFCGEVLDVDALTGGYNIRTAMATGCLAGRSAAGERRQ